MNRFSGKIIGSALGFAFGGGPLGAVVGLVLGHIYDKRPPSSGNSLWETIAAAPFTELTGQVQQAAFTMGVIVLGAKMAKADGRVTRAEIETFKRVFNIPSGRTEAVGRLFDQARQSAQGFEPHAMQLAHVFRNNPVVLEEVLTGLFLIAAADNAGLSQAEVVFLQRVATIFGFSAGDFARIAARSGVQLPNQPNTKASENSFAILGVREDATNDEIKTAYRALIREHHPDKLVAAGLPPEFIAVANEKMKRINVAYDEVCKTKGIK